jgi:hypothetical protein
MDRALSFFGVYDVFGYLASGLSAVVGIWWLTAGSIPHLSIVGVLGLLGAGYMAGQISAILGNLWESLWWKRKGNEKPYARMLKGSEEGFGKQLGAEIRSRIDAEAQVEGLVDKGRFNFARTKLRLEGFEERAETMRALHGLCRNLAATAAVLSLVAAGTLLVEGPEKRLWIALGLSSVAIFAFGSRALSFERRFGREVWFSYLVLQVAPRRG